MTSCFVLTGPMGSGKTPILRELRSSGFACVAEPAREILADQRAIDGNGVPDKDPALFCSLMLSRASSDFERMCDSTAPVFFDRAIPDMIGYAELFGLDSSAASNAAGLHRYNDTVFFTPSWPEIYTTDDERKMFFEQADAFGSRVREIYDGLGYEVLEVPRDTPGVRAAFIMDMVAERTPNG